MSPGGQSDQTLIGEFFQSAGARRILEFAPRIFPVQPLTNFPGELRAGEVGLGSNQLVDPIDESWRKGLAAENDGSLGLRHTRKVN